MVNEKQIEKVLFDALYDEIATDSGVIREYYDDGKISYTKVKDYESWFEYDPDGKWTKVKDSAGMEFLYEYDTNGNLETSKDSSGYFSSRKYDSESREVYFKDSFGYEEWSEYDENGIKHMKNSAGEEYKFLNDNMLYFKSFDGVETWYDPEQTEEVEEA